MAHYKELFTLYTRMTKSGVKVYYYRTYDENGNRTHGISTGMTMEHAAKLFCMNLYKAGKLVPKRTQLFSEYTENFWVWGKCRYIIRCNTMGRKGISPEHARTERGYLVNHLQPYFGKHKLTAIKPRDIEDFIIHMKQTSGLSDGTINHILKVLKIIMAEAVRDSKLYENPAKEINYINATRQERGILTIEEIRELFDETRFMEIWKGCHVTYALNLFAALTGVRRGEILGLLNKYLHEGYVEIAHSWGSITGIKDTTKTKASRFVPIPAGLSQILHDIQKGGPNGYLFSLDGGEHHYPDNQILIKFYQALEAIGIIEEQRTARGITFHSWRHFFNTLCRVKNISDAKVQAVIGHKTQRMTENYTHFKIEDFKEIIDVQTAFLKEN